jgi:hypothetical protein
MGRVLIGMDPHKSSATIEVIDEHEQVLDQGRYGTDTDGYRQMLAAGRRFPDRRWAVEGSAGIGRHIAQRLVADGESVLDVPSKLSARVRALDTGQGRKTDLLTELAVGSFGQGVRAFGLVARFARCSRSWARTGTGRWWRSGSRPARGPANC